ncbi:MAG TPA: nuclear transport factor 2 family protein [Opitutus sp.]|nr:nuclear transport factor 2 family protein [Opitutus sp.]
MKLQILPLLSLLLLATPLARAASTVSAAEQTVVISAVTAADDERMAAVKAGDSARLNAILSDDLRYAHSNGSVDNKTAFVDSLVTGKTVYENFEYKDRTIFPAAPGIALMSGRVLVKVRVGEQKLSIDLNYLAVWREENGRWRFLSWQSSRNPVPAPVPTSTER